MMHMFNLKTINDIDKVFMFPHDNDPIDLYYEKNNGMPNIGS